MRKPSKLVPVVPSSALPDTGLISTADLIGSARQGIKPIFAISRSMMEYAIADGRLPRPLKTNSGFIAWEAPVLKAFVAEMEAQGV
jgi:predicted DNA-binding transcriptional regulator AlpA